MAVLICDPRKAVSRVDKMAIEHLRAAGIIVPQPAGRPKKETAKKLPKGRVGWKRLDPFVRSGCRQCGSGSSVPGNWPYSMSLCSRCAQIHLNSIKAGLKSSDEVRF